MVTQPKIYETSATRVIYWRNRKRGSRRKKICENEKMRKCIKREKRKRARFESV